MDSTLSIPDSLMKSWYQDQKHGSDFKLVCDRFSEEFKSEEKAKVKKREFKGNPTPQPKSKSAKTVAVDMSGLNIKPIDDAPQQTVLADVNILNLPDCKLVVQCGHVFVKNMGTTKVGCSISTNCNKFWVLWF